MEAVRLLVLLRAMLCTRRGPITTESNDSAVRAVTALYHRLCTWPLIGIGFQIMFLPAATWTRAVGLCGRLTYNILIPFNPRKESFSRVPLFLTPCYPPKLIKLYLFLPLLDSP